MRMRVRKMERMRTMVIGQVVFGLWSGNRKGSGRDMRITVQRIDRMDSL